MCVRQFRPNHPACVQCFNPSTARPAWPGLFTCPEVTLFSPRAFGHFCTDFVCRFCVACSPEVGGRLHPTCDGENASKVSCAPLPQRVRIFGPWGQCIECRIGGRWGRTGGCQHQQQAFHWDAPSGGGWGARRWVPRCGRPRTCWHFSSAPAVWTRRHSAAAWRGAAIARRSRARSRLVSSDISTRPWSRASSSIRLPATVGFNSV